MTAPKMLEATISEIISGQLAREARTAAAVDRARAKGSLYPCPVCGTEKWRDNLCFGCPRRAASPLPGEKEKT